MYNLHFSGSTNNFKPKVKIQNNNSINQNSKLNQYLEKNKKIHKSPAHTLNKSQNISGAQNTFKTNVKNKIINHNTKVHLNNKKILPLQNIKNFHIINKNNKSIKINSLQYQNNLSISKNNSLSNYFTKTCNNINPNLRRNNTNINIMSIQNNTNYTSSNYNINNNNRSNIFQNKSSIYNSKKNPIIKIKDYLKTDDFILNKNNNRSGSFYPLVITEESKKKINNDKKNKSKIKKTESVSNTFIKKSHSSIKKLKTSSTSILNKKNSFILNANFKNNSNNNKNKSRVNSNILGNPTSSSGGFIENLSTEKTSGCAHMDNFELKIINEIKELKKLKKNEINDKIKTIFEEAIDYLIPKESQNVFLLILKEISTINNDYYDNIKQLNNNIELLKIKINNYENKYLEISNKLKKKEKELSFLKKEVDKFYKEKEIKFNAIKNKKISSVDVKIKKRDNLYFKNLNVKNLDDLDALYFFDKVEYNQNNGKEMPKLNLEQKHIEKCIQKEIIKRNEAILTPFQKIALQFEMPDT